jgi:sugar phosphate isomerase/epimerase
MVEPIQSFCHVGLIHCMAFPEVMKGEGPILETLEKILLDDYFSAVELTWIKDPAVRARAASMLEQAHVDVVFAGQPPLLSQKLDLNAPDAAARKKAVDQCKASVDQAYELGARIVAVLSGPDSGDADRPAAKARLVDSLQEICEYAGEKQRDYLLAVSLETFDYNVDKKCLVGPTTLAAEVADAVKAKHSNFGLTIDLSHLPLLNETPEEMVIASIDHLIHVHIGNCLTSERGHAAYGDQHPRFGIAGGENDVEQVQKFLAALIYAGYFKKNTPTAMPVVSFEVKPLPGESSDLVIANAKRVLSEAWAKL